MNDKHKILSTVSLFHAFNDGAVSVIPLLFPVFKTLFNLSYTQIGLITGSGLTVTLISQVVIGRISDKNNSKTFLLIGVLLLSGSLLTIPLSQGFVTLLLFVIILKFSSSFFHLSGIGLISRTFKRDRLDWAMGTQSAFGDFGAFVAILTTLYIAESIGWVFPFYLWFIFGVSCLFIALFLTRGIAEKYLRVEQTNNKKQTVTEAIDEWINIMKRLRLLIPLFIVSGMAWGVTINYLPLFLNEKTPLGLSSIGIIVSLWIGVGTIVCLFYGKIQSYVGRKTIIILAYFTMGVMGFFLAFSTNVPIIIFIVILLGLSTFLTFPALFSFVSEATHESIEGKTLGYIFTLQLGGGAIFLFLSGIFADLFGIWIPFVFLGFASILTAIVLSINRKQSYILN